MHDGSASVVFGLLGKAIFLIDRQYQPAESEYLSKISLKASSVSSGTIFSRQHSFV